ncbi:MAG: RtcB family protein, partial [Candidatus Moraniibacteriota bacterium]
MTYQIESLSPNKKELKTAKMKVPTILHGSDELLPNEETLAKLEDISSDERLFHHVASMSDVHSKKGRKTPTGSVIATHNDFLPQVNDTAPNCGMRLLKTDLNEESATPEQLEQLFQELVKVIPTKKYLGTPISFRLALDVCKEGIAPLRKHFGSRTKNEIENAFANGNFFRNEKVTDQDLLNAVPKLFFHIGKYRLGILGAAGNHFLDLMKITELKNPELAEKFGLKNGQYVFLMHTGSGLFGQYASYMYTPKKKEHLSQQIILKLGTSFFGSQLKNVYQKIAQEIEKYKNSNDFIGYKADSAEGQMFFTAHK